MHFVEKMLLFNREVRYQIHSGSCKKFRIRPDPDPGPQHCCRGFELGFDFCTYQPSSEEIQSHLPRILILSIKLPVPTYRCRTWAKKLYSISLLFLWNINAAFLFLCVSVVNCNSYGTGNDLKASVPFWFFSFREWRLVMCTVPWSRKFFLCRAWSWYRWRRGTLRG